MAESEEILKSLLMKVKEESEKAGLKFNILNSTTGFLFKSLLTLAKSFKHASFDYFIFKSINTYNFLNFTCNKK